MYHNPLAAYQAVDNATMSGREIEARVLSQAAGKLRQCQSTWHVDAEAPDRLDEALRYNQKVWTLLQSELGREDNPLPPELRRNLLQLSAFVDRQTFDAMAYPAPEKLTMIIRINENIAAGLRNQPEPSR